MPIYLVKANFYYSHGEFMEGDKRMHIGTVIQAGTKFASEETEYISELVRSGIVEPYQEVIPNSVFGDGTPASSGSD